MWMNKKLLWVLLGVIVVIAVLTNPTSDQHAAAFMTFMLHQTSEEITDTNTSVKPLADGLSVSSKNYWLFSLTTLKQNQESKDIGFGAFGNVWIFR